MHRSLHLGWAVGEPSGSACVRPWRCARPTAGGREHGRREGKVGAPGGLVVPASYARVRTDLGLRQLLVVALEALGGGRGGEGRGAERSGAERSGAERSGAERSGSPGGQAEGGARPEGDAASLSPFWLALAREAREAGPQREARPSRARAPGC